MDRRMFVSLAAAGLHGLLVGRLLAQTGSVDKELLRRQLEQGLRVTRKDQKDYIDRVVTLVDQKKLPLALVYGIFKWARKRHPQYPFPFFQRALDGRAKAIGVDI